MNTECPNIVIDAIESRLLDDIVTSPSWSGYAFKRAYSGYGEERAVIVTNKANVYAYAILRVSFYKHKYVVWDYLTYQQTQSDYGDPQCYDRLLNAVLQTVRTAHTTK